MVWCGRRSEVCAHCRADLHCGRTVLPMQYTPSLTVPHCIIQNRQSAAPPPRGAPVARGGQQHASGGKELAEPPVDPALRDLDDDPRSGKACRQTTHGRKGGRALLPTHHPALIPPHISPHGDLLSRAWPSYCAEHGAVGAPVCSAVDYYYGLLYCTVDFRLEYIDYSTVLYCTVQKSP